MALPQPIGRYVFRPARLAALGLLALLGACGGGGGSGGSGPAPAACDAGPRKLALSNYFNDWYFWYRSSPRPDPNGGASLDEHFKALLYTGGDGAFPADRWSFQSTTESFNRFYGDGRTLGYGVSVAGLEVAGRPDLPLYVRYVAPLSPAANAGVVRGDRILSLNGRAVADIISANDFSSLTPAAEGNTLSVELASAAGGGRRGVNLTAAIYALVPVTNHAVLTTAGGKLVGYLAVKDMISQAVQPVADALASYRNQGVSELVIDLRYNGGGLVSVGRDIASLIAGPRGLGRNYTSLIYNDKQAARNTVYGFNNPAQALGLQRVYILSGERTCSASEQLISGLRPVVDVVVVGDTTCGKPVGFLPSDDGCGNTHSVVNFESLNGANEGRYVDGLHPNCAVAEDWSQPLGSAAEPLLAKALAHASGAVCTAAGSVTQRQALALRRAKPQVREGDAPAMIDR